MSELLKKLLDQIMKHGLLVTLLCLLTYVYWTQNNRLHTKIEQCNQSIIDIYKEQNDLLIKTVDKNTTVLENLSVLLNNQ
ncbi:MAG: hypothetical protein AAF705_11400 [Bacteroidota bacterium]